ncbi:hypothetical protein E8E13_007167 [Curvularia kusanoi]|uniref:Uncharacterized protein n=1 Tax=Curvularia kusanoi TaxID=90978 RepID=A0A9P4TBB5_CURKU|nr:hypothetical protein E8E13_007167 [Curvularia kusanoi]
MGHPIRVCPWIEYGDAIDGEPAVLPSVAYSDEDDDRNHMVANWNALLREEEADGGRLSRLRQKARERGDIDEAALLGMEIAKSQRLAAGIRERVQKFKDDQGPSVQTPKGAAHQADLNVNVENDGQHFGDRGAADRGYQLEERMPSRVRHRERREQREFCGGGGSGRYQRSGQTRVPGHEQRPAGYAQDKTHGYYPGEGQWR